MDFHTLRGVGIWSSRLFFVPFPLEKLPCLGNEKKNIFSFCISLDFRNIANGFEADE
jgi:hypothetical protein